MLPGSVASTLGGGKITFTQFKGRNRKPKRLVLPILPMLQKIIDASPCGEMTYLVNDLGRPFTDAGFGNWFRDRCDEADVATVARTACEKRARQSLRITERPRINSWQSSAGHTLKMAEAIHARGRSTAARRSRNAHAQNARTKRHRNVSHRSASGTFSEKVSKINANLADGARGGN